MVITTEALRRLIDDLSDEEAERVPRVFTIADPVERSLALAPIDDEAWSDDDLALLKEAREKVARGETSRLRRSTAHPHSVGILSEQGGNPPDRNVSVSDLKHPQR